MKRGNNSILALGIIFFLLMVFLLFESGVQSHLAKNLFSGSFSFDISKVNKNVNASKNIEGSLNFTILRTDVNNLIINITSTSFFRVILTKSANEYPFDKEFTLEAMKDATTPKIEFVDYSGYKVPNVTVDSITYSIPLDFFAISYDSGGNYNLSFDLRYNSTSIKSLFYSQINIFVNDSNINVNLPGVVGAPRLKKNIPNIDLSKLMTYNFSLDDYFVYDENIETGFDVVGDLQANISSDDQGIIHFTATADMSGKDIVSFTVENEFGIISSNNVTITYKGVVNESEEKPENVTETSACTTNWQCDGWNKCSNGQRTRECNDENSCNITTGKPHVTQKCTIIEDNTQQEQTTIVGDETLQKVKLIPLKNNSVTTTVLGFSPTAFLIIVIVLSVVLGGGTFAYFKFVRKDGEKEVVAKKENNPIVGTVDTKVGVQEVKAEVKPQTQQPVQEAKLINAEEIYKYLETTSKAGLDIEKAKENLIKTGWNKADVERAANVMTLKKYVSEKLMKGFDKQQLRDSLSAKGWKQELLDEVFVK